MKRGIFLLLLIGVASWSACSILKPMPHYNPDKPHHTPRGFVNNYTPVRQRTGGLLKWLSQRDWDRTKNVEFPMAENDPAWIKANHSEATLTWIGHSTFLLQYQGINILTDPHLTERASPMPFGEPSRWAPPGLDFHELPKIDVVIISHNHYDHLDLETVKRLSKQPGGSPLFLVPLGLKAWFAKQDIDNVIERDWWESHKVGEFEYHAVPVQHFSARTAFDRNKTLWAGWVLDAPGFRFFFMGDSGYSKDFADIGERFGSFDLAAIAIGAYDPRWFMSVAHVDPEEAVQVYQDLKARYAVGMHWGTFKLTDEPMDEPPKRLATARKAAGISDEQFFVMQHGEMRKLDFLSR